ncbi:MAG: ATP-binding protein [Verrucomicrobiota bacterium]
MQPRSFQTRLAFLAALVSGVILLSFGLAAWFLIQDQYIRSVDARIGSAAREASEKLFSRNNWFRFEERWQNGWPEKEFENVQPALLILNREDTPLHIRTGSHWLLAKNLGQWHPNPNSFPRLAPPESEFEQFDFRPGSPFLDERYPTQKGNSNRPKPPRKKGPPPQPYPSPQQELGSDNSYDPPLMPPPGPGDFREKIAPPPASAKFFTLRKDDGSSWRMVALGNPEATMFTGVNLASYAPEMRRAQGFFLIAVPVGLFAIATGGWLIARRALRPLQRITKTASHVTASDLSERIPVTGHEYHEFSQLVATLNTMIGRLESSFHQATRFTADASHELKTPIALMQAEVDTALKTAPPNSQEEQTLLNIAEEVQRLKRITQSLLFLSQVDSGKVTLTKDRIDLSHEIEALCEDAEVLSADAGLTLTHAIEPSVFIMADSTLLTQAIQNLLTNAVKYNRKDGALTCHLTRSRDQAHIYFINSGPGIPESARAQIFDRFYRVDPARGREKDGFGLGLNLALEIIRAHNGTLELTDPSPDHTTFLVRLPLAPDNNYG